jgi:hypothetical protein
MVVVYIGVEDATWLTPDDLEHPGFNIGNRMDALARH